MFHLFHSETNEETPRLLLFFVSTLPSSVIANSYQECKDARINPADGKILALNLPTSEPAEPAGPTHYGKAQSHEILILDGLLNTRIITRIISSLYHKARSRWQKSEWPKSHLLCIIKNIYLWCILNSTSIKAKQWRCDDRSESSSEISDLATSQVEAAIFKWCCITYRYTHTHIYERNTSQLILFLWLKWTARN